MSYQAPYNYYEKTSDKFITSQAIFMHKMKLYKHKTACMYEYVRKTDHSSSIDIQKYVYPALNRTNIPVLAYVSSLALSYYEWACSYREFRLPLRIKKEVVPHEYLWSVNGAVCFRYVYYCAPDTRITHDQ